MTEPTGSTDDEGNEDRAPGARGFGAPHSILLVGRQPDRSGSLLRAVAEEGYRVASTSSASEALSSLRSDPADLVIADLDLPGMSGLQLLGASRQIDPTVGFVLLVDMARIPDGVEALRRGADSYIVQPFDLDELRHAVQRTLQHRCLLLESRRSGGRRETEMRTLASRIENAFMDALLAVTDAVESRDGYDEGSHVRRVMSHALATAKAMGLSGEQVRKVCLAALLHDIGKIAIPEEILRKPARLTPLEDTMMRRHPVIAAAIAQRSRLLRPAATAILHQHERWDGAGYPHGLSGTQIPVESRILGVAEAYDALITRRPYRAKRTGSEAIVELRRCAGAQFDADVVDAFIHSFGRAAPEEVPLLTDPAFVDGAAA